MCPYVHPMSLTQVSRFFQDLTGRTGTRSKGPLYQGPAHLTLREAAMA